MRKPANRRRFLLTKGDDEYDLDPQLADMLAVPAPNEGALLDEVRKDGADEATEMAVSAALRLLNGVNADMSRESIAKLGASLYPQENETLNTGKGAGGAPTQVSNRGSNVQMDDGEFTDDGDDSNWDEDDDTDQMAVGKGKATEGEDEVEKRTFTDAERKNLASRGQAESDGSYPIANKCLAGDTLVPLLDGRVVRLADLVGEQPWLYAYDTKMRAVVPAQAAKVWMSEEAAPMLSVRLDDGSVIECTANHPFMLRDGTYLAADELQPGVSLMPLQRKVSKLRGGGTTGTYEHVWQPFFGYWEPTHRMVFRGHEGALPDRGLYIHHRDGHSLNNDPQNLGAVSQSEHRRLHFELDPESAQQRWAYARETRWANPDARKKQSLVMKRENEARLADGRGALIAQRIAAKKRKHLPDEQIVAEYLDGATATEIAARYGTTRNLIGKRLREAGVDTRNFRVRGRQRTEAGRFNHKVVAVTLSGVGPVFDLEVPGFHNFALQAGVFVHNSDLKNAIQAFGRSKDKGKTKAHIIARAKALGATSMLPKGWTVSKSDETEGGAPVDSPTSVPIMKEDGTWDLSGVPAEARPFYEATLAKADEAAAEAASLREDLKKTAEKADELAETLKEREFIAKADSEFPTVGPKEEVAQILKAANEAFPEELYEKFETLLKAANERIATGDLFAELGRASRGEVTQTGGAYAEIEKMAAELVTKGDEANKDVAFERVIKEHPELYNRYLAENPAQWASGPGDAVSQQAFNQSTGGN